jgi:hypothetical protein
MIILLFGLQMIAQEDVNVIKHDRFTQSSAQLTSKKRRKAIQDVYGKRKQVVPYFSIISRAIVKEEEMNDSHYVFYQGTRSEWSVPQDLYTQLYAYFHPETEVKEFKFLRFQDESTQQRTARDFLVHQLEEHGLVNDNSELGAVLLSANLALFGNVGFPGECTWDYFIGRTESKRVPTIDWDYKPMLESLGLTTKYIDEIVALEDLVKSKEQILTQIFIPKEKADTFAYLAWVRGIPAHKETIDWILKNVKSKRYADIKDVMGKLETQFKEEQEKNPIFKELLEKTKKGDFSIASFLHEYRNRPWEIKGMNYVTARLLFTPEFMLNPKSGLKFYRYSTAPRDQLKEYDKKLNEIVNKLIEEKKSREAAEVEG